MTLAVLACLLATIAVPNLRALAAETPEQKAARMAWFSDARFGMFIHWGLYAVLAGEWKGHEIPGAGEWIMETGKLPVSEYEQLVHRFNPVKFNARDWVRTARQAGMKYIVITSKHHEGFGLWKSAVSDYDVEATPFGRDILKELSRGLRRGRHSPLFLLLDHGLASPGLGHAPGVVR